MANLTIYDSNTGKNIYVHNPNNRFATTFLDTRYRDKAVDGETMQDKATGEIYLKRKTDGKIVSFNQNEKELPYLMFQKKCLENASGNSFVHPTQTSNPDAKVVVENWDLTTARIPYTDGEANEDGPKTMYNILNDSDEPYEVNYNKQSSSIEFLMSDGLSTGVFVNVQTRNCDKLACEYLSDIISTNNAYNLRNKNNAVITWYFEMPGLYCKISTPIRLNHMCLINLPISSNEQRYVIKYDDKTVTDKSIIDIYNEKNPDDMCPITVEGWLNWVKEEKIKNGGNFNCYIGINDIDFSDIRKAYTQLKADDTGISNYFYPVTNTNDTHEILLTHMTSIHYVNDIKNILSPNDYPNFIIGITDVGTADNEADLLVDRSETSSILTSDTRPENWTLGKIWSERIVDIHLDTGAREATGSSTRMKNLAKALAGYNVINNALESTEETSPAGGDNS